MRKKGNLEKIVFHFQMYLKNEYNFKLNKKLFSKKIDKIQQKK